jgi:UDP:flavonoid glycosyltransferase YjiC (YdhE family)
MAGRPQTCGPRVLSLLVELAETMVDDLIEVITAWGADLMVFEPTAFAGPLAAAALGVPAVRHLYGTDLMSAAARFLPGSLAPACEKLGLDSVNPFGLATVDPCPTELQVAVASRRLPVRYVPFNGSGSLPPEMAQQPGRPRVCVTWGTTLSRLDSQFFLVGEVVRAVRDLEADVVAAITPGQEALLGRLPTEVHVVQSAPLHLLLRTCDAVVAHGGAGTILTAAASGVPQLLIPRLPDHVRHAARLAAAGAGIVLPAAVAAGNPGMIRDRLTDLLSTPAYRAAAERLRHDIQRQPSPVQIVRELEHHATGAVTRIWQLLYRTS